MSLMEWMTFCIEQGLGLLILFGIPTLVIVGLICLISHF